MTRFLLVMFLAFLPLASCTTISPVRPAATTRAAIPGDAANLLDTVIGDWLSNYRDQPGNPPHFAILLGANLPEGYHPKFEGWTILVVEETDPEYPPTRVQIEHDEYVFKHHSSYDDQEKVMVLQSGRGTPPAVTRTVNVDYPVVLQVDRLIIHGDTAEVEISQDRHHNMGASGATYSAQRTGNTWKCHSDGGWIW